MKKIVLLMLVAVLTVAMAFEAMAGSEKPTKKFAVAITNLVAEFPNLPESLGIGLSVHPYDVLTRNAPGSIAIDGSGFQPAFSNFMVKTRFQKLDTGFAPFIDPASGLGLAMVTENLPIYMDIYSLFLDVDVQETENCITYYIRVVQVDICIKYKDFEVVYSAVYQDGGFKWKLNLI